ncbi:MAG: hypothetical protein JNM70_16175 [Anaerolineae bacterium]|nr:hypothetical protein [Anaerolineae bacterium]
MTTLAQQHEQDVRRTPSASRITAGSFRLNELHFLALAYGLTGLAWIGAAAGIGLLAALGVWLLVG